MSLFILGKGERLRLEAKTSVSRTNWVILIVLTHNSSNSVYNRFQEAEYTRIPANSNVFHTMPTTTNQHAVLSSLGMKLRMNREIKKVPMNQPILTV